MKQINKYQNYDFNTYMEDIKNDGLKKTWNSLCKYLIENSSNLNNFLNPDNLGELYEMGLAIQDKKTKKTMGKYYTPVDVANLMCKWFSGLKGDCVCDVGCGTGKLILTYLNILGNVQSKNLISSGKLYLYDIDSTALEICKTIIAIKFGIKISKKINIICDDFLDKEIILPRNCKVISNPPYTKFKVLDKKWEKTKNLVETKEAYASFMEKIFKQAKSAVIISPFSFISSAKFYYLREEMSQLGTGFIVSFDNVPGNIFCGKKYGIFNTNTGNSVRAAITVFEKNPSTKGFKISPLIRFKNNEREQLLKNSVLEKVLGKKLQIVDKDHQRFKKIFNELNDVYNLWISKSSITVKKLLVQKETEFYINMPNTCRYFTTASTKKLSRNGSITIFTDEQSKYDFLYCFINSSFTYWWWRIYDGGITFPISLLNEMPIPFELLSNEDKLFFSRMRKEMSSNESNFIVTKVNAGALQENIKFPENYRNKINKRILKIIGANIDAKVFDLIHNNKFFNNK